MSAKRVTSSVLLVLGFLALAAGPGRTEDRPVVERTAWGAQAAHPGMKEQVPVRLTLHHTATNPNSKLSLAAKLKSLQSFSQSNAKLSDGRLKKAWADIPYHFYIDVNGAVGEGRDVRFVGDTNTAYNPSGHIGIVLEGNFEKTAPTPAQVAATVELLARLAAKYKIGVEAIGVHRDFAQTACPGRNFLAIMPDIKAEVARKVAGG